MNITATYTLIDSIDGVSILTLKAPTGKYIGNAAFIKQEILSSSFEMAAKFKALGASVEDDEEDDKKNKKNKKNDDKVTGKNMLYYLYSTNGADIEGVFTNFKKMCTKSPVCTFEGAEVSAEFLDKLPLNDLEGLISEYLENFITI